MVLDELTLWHFQSTSKEVIWPKQFLNYMHGLKSALWQFFRKGWDGCAMLVGPLKMHLIILFVLGADEYLERLEGKIR